MRLCKNISIWENMYVGKDYIWYTRNTDIWKRVISHSIYFPYLLLPELKVMGGLLEPITADIGRKQGDTSLTHRRVINHYSIIIKGNFPLGHGNPKIKIIIKKKKLIQLKRFFLSILSEMKQCSLVWYCFPPLSEYHNIYKQHFP